MIYSGNDGTSSQLSTRAPFHLEATVRVLQRRPANLVEAWEHDRCLRVLKTSDDLALVEVENRGTIDEPDVRYTLRHGDPSTVARRELAQTLRKVLGLDVDSIPMQRLLEAAQTTCEAGPTAQSPSSTERFQLSLLKHHAAKSCPPGLGSHRLAWRGQKFA